MTTNKVEIAPNRNNNNNNKRKRGGKEKGENWRDKIAKL